MAERQATVSRGHALEPAPVIDERGATVSVTIAPDAVAEPAGVRIAVSHGEDASGWWIGLGADARVVAGIGTVSGPVSLTVGPLMGAGAEAEVVVQLPGSPGDRLELQVRTAGGGDPATAAVVIGSPMLAPRGPLRRGARAMRGGVAIQPFAGTVSQLSVVPRKHPGNLGRAL